MPAVLVQRDRRTTGRAGQLVYMGRTGQLVYMSHELQVLVEILSPKVRWKVIKEDT